MKRYSKRYMDNRPSLKVILSLVYRGVDILRKRAIIVGIIIFSITMVGILAVSPMLIDSKVNPNSQWIAFYASYFGGIFGGVVSGSLTLGGVYLTIRHQNNLLAQEKAEKFRYVYEKLLPGFWSLDLFIKNKMQLSPAKQIEQFHKNAKSFLEIVEANMHVIQSDYKIMIHIEFIARRLKYISNYNLKNPDQKIIEDFTRLNEEIQMQYERLEGYERSLH